MRWSDGLIPLVALAVGVVASPTGHATSEAEQKVRANLEAQVAALSKTDGLLADKLETRTKELQRRVRSLHRAMRGSDLRVWFDPKERFELARRRAAARRILSRDRAELSLLHAEIAAARRNRAALNEMRKHAGSIAVPESILSPVAGTVITARFGAFKGKRSRTDLTRRGVDILAAAGDEVRAPADGTVRFAGDIRGLGSSVLIGHGGFFTLVGRLERAEVARGDRVTRGQRVGQTAERRVYLEVRLDIGGGGQPIDPAPLLRER
jgi:septal ring factor EnvC (AmiA/AmiB activator)